MATSAKGPLSRGRKTAYAMYSILRKEDVLMLSATTSKRLDALGEISRQGKPVNGLFRLMDNPCLWENAYANIYANKGAMTRGVDGVTLDGFSDERAINIIKLLKDGRYKFKPSKRVYIPKANGKMRPLGIPSGDDKLVQEVVRAILERIYEPVFKDSSHGFRRGRSCHTALRYLQKYWTGVKWIIDMDIQGFFDNIDHDVMIKLLEKRIDDKRFINLIKAMLKAGYIDDWKYHATHSGTPQGGIVSPILANIYLHELDEFMENLVRDFNKGKRRCRNEEYLRYQYLVRRQRIRYDRALQDGETEKLRGIKAELRECSRIRQNIPSVDFHDDGYKRLTYIRYADDYLIGVIGTKEDCNQITQSVCDFVEEHLKLQISKEKSGLRHSTEETRFLGYDITTYPVGKAVKMKLNGTHTTKRLGAGQIQLKVPEDRMVQFCRKNGYGNYDTLEANPRLDLINLMDTQILTIYNSELRGFANYYVLAQGAVRAMHKMSSLWFRSLTRTLARKHNCSKRRIRSSLKVEPGEYAITEWYNGKQRTTRLYRLKDLKYFRSNVLQNFDQIPNTLMYRATYSKILSRMRGQECEFCGRKGGYFEVHHAGKMSNVADGVEPWKKLMCERNQKTLMLCVHCHQRLHDGNLPDMRKHK